MKLKEFLENINKYAQENPETIGSLEDYGMSKDSINAKNIDYWHIFVNTESQQIFVPTVLNKIS